MISELSLSSIGHHEEPSYGINPYHPLRRLWEYIMYYSSFIVLWEIPFEWTFNFQGKLRWVIPSLVVDSFFLADIFIVLKTGVLHRGVIKNDKDSISQTIPLWRKIIYWICPIPFYLIGYFAKNHVLYNVLLLLKVLRFFRLYDANYVIKNTLVYISPFSKISRLFTTLITIIHICACAFWYTGHVEIPNRSWLTETFMVEKPKLIQYFHTVYYISTTVLTIGYGDLHPYTFPEVCVVICVEIVGVFFYNFLVSTMVSIVADPSRNSFLNKYMRISSVFKYRRISESSMEELLRYYEYVWEMDRDRADFFETAEKMPIALQKKLALALHADVFEKVEIFKNADEEVLQSIAMALRPRVFTPGDFLIKAGRVATRMYFVTEGKVDLISPSGSLLRVNDGYSGFVLGETSVVGGDVVESSAIAETYVEAFELTKDDFDEIAEEHPQLVNGITSYVSSRKDRNKGEEPNNSK
ncbi:cyclic nucleotide-binding domain containing protein [Trichomonas vaginalis G3]|uniref:Cyclic nucleotide-binding domain containing protein n=1 Tax=Trichomonas vaginalis (strain ATCC PRA-98 / G3) TaxID=412133 RepID=A2DL14_TRIV3|nr:cyclic nucleotide-gated ion channel protein [Trichomonas vaginalis G3]EAY18967.1 cyclic nucleotide-binding domain containing protein [Trichomonas vaginalis G3]KAI5532033.1 cyclic nucleotide-gated ion channel protein [Trichomonas vaginalis G3]|eukprot:XP_001579953.1 cyclic nucleotide-binding domain containing protein [Trichomonas vaginalis G3]